MNKHIYPNLICEDLPMDPTQVPEKTAKSEYFVLSYGVLYKVFKIINLDQLILKH